VKTYLIRFSALNYLVNNCVRICLLGDLNLSDFNWDVFIYPDSTLYNCAANFICQNGLEQLVDQPTRGDNILDYVFVQMLFVATIFLI